MAAQAGSASIMGLPPASPDSTEWNSTDQTATHPGNGLVDDQNSPGASNLNFLRGFANPTQKKVTRDGQPAKRRGPKPDSKPAQTRRQELNRQAQRTHRERKEQYIKALEAEISHLREAFVQESATIQSHLKHQQMLLKDREQENIALREILTTRGIPFEGELHNRKAAVGLRSQGTRGISPSYSTTQPSPYTNVLAAPMSASGYSGLREAGFTNGTGSSASGHSPITHHSHSPPDIQERGFCGTKDPPMPDVPGVFEKDPQLGIDFILALEETCRDHGEYLVRRSMNSPNDPEQALFSGHALMASCPPPSHIERTAAQMGGLQPTYPHQAPQVSLDALNRLLNLSKVIKSEGYVEGGQVTPIMALQSLRGHHNYTSLTREDVVGMIDSIRNKVRCYGFGAVMEDFELRDALAAIFATKPEAYESFGDDDMTAEIDDMYS